VNIQGQNVGGPSKPNTPTHVVIEDSSNINKEEENEKEVEEDLVRFEDVMSVASQTVDALEDPKLSQNISDSSGKSSFPFYLIQRVIHLCPHHMLSPKSSGTECSSKPQMSISIISPEFEDFCQCDASDSVGWHRDVIILLNSDSNSDVEILDI